MRRAEEQARLGAAPSREEASSESTSPVALFQSKVRKLWLQVKAHCIRGEYDPEKQSENRPVASPNGPMLEPEHRSLGPEYLAPLDSAKAYTMR